MLITFLKTAESTTLESMLQGLEAPAGALVIMDRGIATEANILNSLENSGYMNDLKEKWFAQSTWLSQMK